MYTFLLALVLCFSDVAVAQQVTNAQRNAFYTKQKEFQKQGEDALEREQARAKQPLCPKAQNNVDSQFCLKDEFQKTDANRVLYVRSIGALLRLSVDTSLPLVRKPLPFDDGETAWLAYRDHTCQAIYDSYQGGSGAAGASWDCQLTVTRNHMRELSDVWAQLW